MKFMLALGALILALAVGVPFVGAVMLAIVVWAMAHVVRQGSGDAKDAAIAPAAPAQPAQPTPLEREEGVPDGSDAAHLRLYLARLNARIQGLEAEVAALRKHPPLAQRPPPEPMAMEIPALPAMAAVPFRSIAAPAAAPAPEEIAPQAPAAVPPVEPASVPLAKEAAFEAAATALPQEPAGPTFLSRLFSGNIVAKAGAIILFFGVGFLLKFAYDRNMVSPEVRVLAVALAAIAAFVVGWKLLDKRRLYGVILQGVAGGLAYLDVFFALKTYGFIGAPAGFVLFAILGVAIALQAVRLEAKPLALLGLTGAFMAPILASTGEGNVVVLFSYYLLLNLFILGMSWWRSWRAVNVTGWFFTFAVAVLWGARSYRPELFGTVEPFLLAFFAIYLVIPILFATVQPPELKGWVDGTLVFGTPAAVAILQGRLVWDLPYGLAWSCAVGALLYGVLSAIVFRHRNMRLLGQTYVALAVGLGTLAIFYAFGAYTTFALWTIEGAAILWVCLKQKSLAGRIFGILVQVAGAGLFFLDYADYDRINPWFNDAILGCAIIAVASFISAVLYRRYEAELHEGEQNLPGFLLAWGAIFYSLGGLDVIHHVVQTTTRQAQVAILFFSITGVVAEWAGARMRWGTLRGLTVMHAPILVAAAFLAGEPLNGLGWVAWPVAFASLFWCLHRQRIDGFDAAWKRRYAAAWIILAWLATWQALYWTQKHEYASVLVMSLAGYVAAGLRFRLREHCTEGSTQFSTAVLLWAMVFWFLAGLGWIRDHEPALLQVRVALAFVTVSALAYWFVSSKLDWPALGKAAQLQWIAMPALLLIDFSRNPFDHHPFGHAWGLAWAFALGWSAWSLKREEANERYLATAYRHGVLLYVPLVLVTWELLWWLMDREFGSAWLAALAAVPAGLALLAATAMRETQRWPLNPLWPLYRDTLLVPIVLGLAGWALIINVRAPGSLAPLGIYIPLLNPIDASIALAAFAVVTWIRSKEISDLQDLLAKGIVVLGFLWLNAIALRTLHYWADVPYRFNAMMQSVLVQATLSILWASSAFALMLWARRTMERKFWIAGAALLVLVVGKLFVIDLANTGTVARIVSFLGVGVMLMVIGYVVPVPPGTKESDGKGAG